MRFTEDQLARWAQSPSQSERDRMDNAERAIRNAIIILPRALFALAVAVLVAG